MRFIKTLEKYPISSIIVLTLLMMLPSFNSLMVTIMEARNFITAREMLDDGNWILTTLNGEPRYEKPPLPTWITAFFGWIFGIENVFALRLPTAFMAATIGVFTFLFSKQFLEKAHSIRNGLIVVTSFYVLAICNEAPWDIFTHAFMLVAIYFLVLAHHTKNIFNQLLAIVFIGFSVLSKGPISLYALLLPFLLAYAVVYGIKNRFLLKTLVPLIGGVLLGGIWFVYVRFADPEAFIKIATTETSNWSSYQVEPFYYYWSFWSQSGLWTLPAISALLYPYLIKRVTNKKAYKLSFLWTIFAVLLLSVIPEKKSRYLMPVLIPMAINTGFYIQYLLENFASIKRKVETLPIYFNFGLLSAVGILFPVVGYFVFKEKLSEVIWLYVGASLVLLVLGTIILFSLIRKKASLLFYSCIMLYVGIMSLAAPALTNFQNENEVFAPIYDLYQETKTENIKLYLFDEISPEMLWDLGTSIPLIDEHDGEYSFPKEKRFGLLVNNKEVFLSSALAKQFQIKEVATYNRNFNKQGSRRHSTRNINYYYVLTKK